MLFTCLCINTTFVPWLEDFIMWRDGRGGGLRMTPVHWFICQHCVLEALFPVPQGKPPLPCRGQQLWDRRVSAETNLLSFLLSGSSDPISMRSVSYALWIYSASHPMTSAVSTFIACCSSPPWFGSRWFLMPSFGTWMYILKPLLFVQYVCSEGRLSHQQSLVYSRRETDSTYFSSFYVRPI